MQVPGREGLYCGIQPQVSSPNELFRCHIISNLPPLCAKGSCVPASPPPNDATALVYLVFGIKGIDKTSVDLRHVLKESQVYKYGSLKCFLSYCLKQTPVNTVRNVLLLGR